MVQRSWFKNGFDQGASAQGKTQELRVVLPLTVWFACLKHTKAEEATLNGEYAFVTTQTDFNVYV